VSRDGESEQPAERANWPIRWRERRGRLANALEDRGVPWPDHERRAFDQAKAEMRKRPVSPSMSGLEVYTTHGVFETLRCYLAAPGRIFHPAGVVSVLVLHNALLSTACPRAPGHLIPLRRLKPL
jgi:hypothetical protein